MLKKNVEPIRRRKDKPRKGSPRKRNSLANVFQVLSRNVGRRWCDVKDAIYDHPKLQDERVRPAIRERLETLLATRHRSPKPFHLFRVNHAGILERIADVHADTDVNANAAAA